MGWFDNEEEHKRLYQLMMEEAAAGRARTVQNRENLTPQSRSDPRIGERPPASNEITETARHREIINVYQTASPDTRVWYDRAVTNDGAWDNWIIRWCLWHVFRYRDDRNRGHNRRSPPRDSYPSQPSTYQPNYQHAHGVSGSPGFYDPVYDGYRNGPRYY